MNLDRDFAFEGQTPLLLSGETVDVDFSPVKFITVKMEMF